MDWSRPMQSFKEGGGRGEGGERKKKKEKKKENGFSDRGARQ